MRILKPNLLGIPIPMPSIEEQEKIVDEIISVANGKQTRAEVLGYTKSMDVYVLGPVV